MDRVWTQLLRIGTIFAITAAASLAADQPPAKNGYLGSFVCKTCHQDIAFRFYKNAHFSNMAPGTKAPQSTACESCHGPGRLHVAGRGDKTKIISFPDLTPKQVVDTCLKCHESSFSRANIRRSSHTLNEVSCINCHSVHKSDTPKYLLAKTQPELCYTCHSNVRADFSMPFKHRVNEGFMSCTDCHNPHGSFAPTWRMAARPHMVKQAFGNEEPCLKCHTEKRGPFAFEHPPVRIEGCEACHYPHGSTNARLLKRPVTFTLCLECHNGASPFGLEKVGDPIPSSRHNMADPRYRNCTNCHVRIHGSNSDPLFLR